MEHQETCSLCDNSIRAVADTPSYMKEHYIDGAGQLCKECYEIVTVNKEWHSLL